MVLSFTLPTHTLPSPPAPSWLDFLVHQPDKLFEELEIFGPGNLPNLADQISPTLDQLHAAFDPQFLKRTARPLHVEEFLHLFGTEIGSAILVAVQPPDQVG